MIYFKSVQQSILLLRYGENRLGQYQSGRAQSVTPCIHFLTSYGVALFQNIWISPDFQIIYCLSVRYDYVLRSVET
jgi:hypothetical protein